MNREEKTMLKKLSRQDLMEMLVESERHVEQLAKELEETRKQLEDKKIQIKNAGSIAEAALKLSGIFEVAQAAADQYLENLGVSTGAQPEPEETPEPEPQPTETEGEEQ